MIGSVALVHNLTLVTHNTADFQHIPNLASTTGSLPDAVGQSKTHRWPRPKDGPFDTKSAAGQAATMSHLR